MLIYRHQFIRVLCEIGVSAFTDTSLSLSLSFFLLHLLYGRRSVRMRVSIFICIWIHFAQKKRKIESELLNVFFFLILFYWKSNEFGAPFIDEVSQFNEFLSLGIGSNSSVKRECYGRFCSYIIQKNLWKYYLCIALFGLHLN